LIFLISTFHVARITGMSHWCPERTGEILNME
jgi:hypothetical protein